ncbi:hypothetical protein DY000_02037811 [Brassica cretica]|uniref:Uncharacterized protein n=1 Tax=Brassica cretica TaxID=69181 RepID=A0ABQ7BMX0_BRACR|nr:hypothetical protein DY000_02037811 [Brassica cretica]
MNRNPCITIVGEPVEVIFRVLRTLAVSRPEHDGPSDHGSGEEPRGKRPVGNGQGTFLGPAVNEYLDKEIQHPVHPERVSLILNNRKNPRHCT